MSCKIARGAYAAAPPDWPRARSEAPGGVTQGGAGQKPLETVPAEELRNASERMRQLEASLDQRVREVHQAGFREGEAAGRKHASAELEPVLQRFARTIAELAELRAQILRESEADLLRLALEIARRVVHRELRVEAEAVDALLRYALEKAREHEIHRLRVHPAQKERVRAALERLGHPEVQVAADPGLEPGAAVFATNRGNLDASVETQLREIEQGLTDRFERQGKA